MRTSICIIGVGITNHQPCKGQEDSVKYKQNNKKGNSLSLKHIALLQELGEWLRMNIKYVILHCKYNLYDICYQS